MYNELRKTQLRGRTLDAPYSFMRLRKENVYQIYIVI